MRVEARQDETGGVQTEAGAQVGVDDAGGALDEVLRQQVRHPAQGDVDRHRHDGEGVAPQHHHRQRRLAAFPGGESRQELGMPRMGEADPGQHELGDGVGHDRRGHAGTHQIDGGGDRLDDGPGIGRIRRAGRGGDGRPARQRQHRQGAGKHLDRVVGLDLGHRHRQAEPVGGGFQEGGIADELERRHRPLAPQPPRGERDLRPDPGRIAEGEGERSVVGGHGPAYSAISPGAEGFRGAVRAAAMQGRRAGHPSGRGLRGRRAATGDPTLTPPRTGRAAPEQKAPQPVKARGRSRSVPLGRSDPQSAY
ncbi:hypothetical protein CHKEEEPN_4072 [Methylorubrum podarium]|nr:hypothetical protein CHKEEEPN_4072 [Methylorubrum podarium]